MVCCSLRRALLRRARLAQRRRRPARLYSLVMLALRGTGLPLLRERQVAWLAVAMAAPMLAAVAVQAMHHEFVPRYFDSAARLLLGGAIALHLIQRRVNVLQAARRGDSAVGAAVRRAADLAGRAGALLVFTALPPTSSTR